MIGSPTDLLAAARSNPVGPYLPVTWDLLAKIGEWIGPAECYANGFMVHDHVDRWDLAPLHMCVEYAEFNIGREHVPTHVRLDTRRREVQHLLCDLGVAPEWARKSAVACWCAGMGVSPIGTMPLWARNSTLHDFERVGVLASTLAPSGWSIVRHRTVDIRPLAKGPETGALGRACADIAALRARCILAEKDGLYVPLHDGGFGWWGHG